VGPLRTFGLRPAPFCGGQLYASSDAMGVIFSSGTPADSFHLFHLFRGSWSMLGDLRLIQSWVSFGNYRRDTPMYWNKWNTVSGFRATTSLSGTG
jgi:hypothetical protein